MATTAASHPLQRIAGVAECLMSDALAARLPERSAAAPWSTRVEAVMWLHRAAPGAKQHLPAGLRGERTVPLTIGAFIRYLDTPVGAYGEVLAAPVLLARAPLPPSVVPFIAVDSLASIHGGRANWALPKTLARFDWSAPPQRLGEQAFSVSGHGEDPDGPSWSVAADVSPRSRRLPIRFPLNDVQLAPDGRELAIEIAVRGQAQLARVEVRSEGPTLPGWLLSGRHHGIVLSGTAMTFGAPR